MADKKALSLLTDGEKRVIREMLQHVEIIENSKWYGKPLWIGLLVSISSFLAAFFWVLSWTLVMTSREGLPGKSTSNEPSFLIAIVFLLAIFVAIAVVLIIIAFLLYTFFFKRRRNESIAELDRIRKQVPEARSAIAKLKLCFTLAEDLREFPLAHDEFPHPSWALQQLITEPARRS